MTFLLDSCVELPGDPPPGPRPALLLATAEGMLCLSHLMPPPPHPADADGTPAELPQVTF